MHACPTYVADITSEPGRILPWAQGYVRTALKNASCSFLHSGCGWLQISGVPSQLEKGNTRGVLRESTVVQTGILYRKTFTTKERRQSQASMRPSRRAYYRLVYYYMPTSGPKGLVVAVHFQCLQYHQVLNEVLTSSSHRKEITLSKQDQCSGLFSRVMARPADHLRRLSKKPR